MIRRHFVRTDKRDDVSHMFEHMTDNPLISRSLTVGWLTYKTNMIRVVV